jgi:hypothetical protein
LVGDQLGLQQQQQQGTGPVPARLLHAIDVCVPQSTQGSAINSLTDMCADFGCVAG